MDNSWTLYIRTSLDWIRIRSGITEEEAETIAKHLDKDIITLIADEGYMDDWNHPVALIIEQDGHAHIGHCEE